MLRIQQFISLLRFLIWENFQLADFTGIRIYRTAQQRLLLVPDGACRAARAHPQLGRHPNGRMSALLTRLA